MNGEKQAVEFATEIYRKKKVAETTASRKLFNDYCKSIDEDEKELEFFCKEMGLNILSKRLKAVI